jgi:2-polyprenylphenol 6-hydroxylase
MSSIGNKLRDKQVPHILVVGAGPTGLALAAALLAQNQLSQPSITVVDRSDFMSASLAIDQLHNTRPLDSRVYSITPTNERFLQSLGAWQLIDQARIAPVSAIEVCAPQRLLFDQHNDAGPLAWIVEHRAIANALTQALLRESNDHLQMVERVSVSKIESVDHDFKNVSLSNGNVIRCNLIVGADGKDSAIRGMFDFQTSYKPYNQIALVANWVCDKPHNGVARQWFDAPGTLALLPLPTQMVDGKQQSSVSIDDGGSA